MFLFLHRNRKDREEDVMMTHHQETEIEDAIETVIGRENAVRAGKLFNPLDAVSYVYNKVINFKFILSESVHEAENVQNAAADPRAATRTEKAEIRKNRIKKIKTTAIRNRIYTHCTS